MNTKGIKMKLQTVCLTALKVREDTQALSKLSAALTQPRSLSLSQAVRAQRDRILPLRASRIGV